MQDKQSVWSNPWVQLALGVICMLTVANLQYGWSSFVKPLQQNFNWYQPYVMGSYTVFILLQTWLAPLHGWLIDRYGSRTVVAVGGALAGSNWIINSQVESLQMLYAAAIIGGIGAGAAITVGPIKTMIKTSGFQDAFFTFGASMAIVVVAALLMAKPTAAILAQHSSLKGATRYNARPMEVLREPAFWMMYLLFALVLAAVLIAGKQYGAIARAGGFLNESAMFIIITLPWLTSEVQSTFGGKILNGAGRPLFGWISDRMGREQVMAIAFGTLAVCMILVTFVSSNRSLFLPVILIIYLCGGTVFTLFPSTLTDSFGTRHAATNFGILYTAKGSANLLVPLGPMMIQASGGRDAMFWMTAIMCGGAALLALRVLAPMREELQQRYDTAYEAGKGHYED